MQVSLRHVAHDRLLDGVVAKIWVFESSGRMPDDDTKLIVPNGMAKIIIPFRNGLVGKYADWAAGNKLSAPEYHS